MVYFTADLHLGHAAIIHMQDRPFEYIDEMNEALIRNINSIVNQNDRLYILGDIAHHISAEKKNELVSRIKGKKYLILGNHDIHGRFDATDMDPGLFEWVGCYRQESLNGMNLIMMHYPLMSWYKQRAGTVMLHGHIHATAEYNVQNIKAGIRRFDVGADANQFMPVSIYQIKAWAEQIGKENGDDHLWEAPGNKNSLKNT